MANDLTSPTCRQKRQFLPLACFSGWQEDRWHEWAKIHEYSRANNKSFYVFLFSSFPDPGDIPQQGALGRASSGMISTPPHPSIFDIQLFLNEIFLPKGIWFNCDHLGSYIPPGCVVKLQSMKTQAIPSLLTYVLSISKSIQVVHIKRPRHHRATRNTPVRTRARSCRGEEDRIRKARLRTVAQWNRKFKSELPGS